MLENGDVITLLHDWVYVKLRELPEKYKGSIVLPSGAAGSDIRLGVVMAFGPGLELPNGVRETIGIDTLDVVAFHRWNIEHQQGKTLGSYLSDKYGLIRGRDILLVFPPGTVEVDFS
jgi:co-chaperonin GroES (HSP10)